jgi:predicted DNA-binding protein (MmcQ/YjbR family)
MDAESARRYLLRLPHVVETMQWGANLVFWVGDKAIGGKMFALVDLDEARNPAKPPPVLSFYAGAETYSSLLERAGVVPAPYLARLKWVALADWHVYRQAELEKPLAAAHAGVLATLPKRTRDLLALPAKQRAAPVAERRRPSSSGKARP